MKNYKYTLVLFFLAFISKAQKVENANVTYKTCSGFAISKPLSEMPVVKDEDLEESEKKEIEIRRKPHTNNTNRTPGFTVDPATQANGGNKLLSPPIANWQGTNGSASPPDPSGAAGPAHYVQAVNLRYIVYNKTGTVLGGPFNLSSLWAGSTNDGDPIVLYDKYANRWFIQQFNGNDKILIAISTSSNPLGSYYTYTFVPDPGNFPDYPKFSIWSDGYYCTANLTAPVTISVFDRTKMLAGNPSAGMIALTPPTIPNHGFYSALPADADGTLPPFGTPCPLFIYEDDTWSGGTDQIHIFKFNADWLIPTNSTLVLDQSLPTTPFNVSFNVNWDDVSQPGTTQKLDAIADVFMYRAQYRRWTNHNSVVLNHAVIVNTTTKQVGIRWYELRQNAVTKVWSIYQQGTYAPDLHSRWLGSIAMDDNGSIGMAFAVSSGTVYPSLRYTGRNASDPLGLMTYTETVAIAGTTSQSGFNNRFGDYSHTSLDPDGITFWHTGEYLSSGAKTRIFSWQIPPAPTGINEINNKPELLVFQNESTLNVKGVKLADENEMQVDLFDVMGKLIIAKKVTPVAGSLETSFDISTLAKGTYLVRVGNETFQKVVKVAVN